MDGVNKLTELAADTFGILGLTRAFVPSACALRGLGIIGLHLLQAFVLGKMCVLRHYGSVPLRNLYLCDLDFLMSFLCHLQDWLCIVWFLTLAMSPINCGCRSARYLKKNPSVV